MLGEENTGGTAVAEDKPKRKAPDRVKYRADDAPLLTEVPTDWTSKFLPLSKGDFADEAVYWDFKSGQLQKSADKARQNAENIRAFGSPEERKAAEQLQKFQKKMDDMVAKMRESGLSEDTIRKLQEKVAQG